MRTVKEVADLTGISVRTLQYYDEIGLFKPTQVTEAGYRLYDDPALEVLQQILFFKELDFSLKDIRMIMEDPGFDRVEAFKKQRTLLELKRDRLNRLLSLLEKLEKGETHMSFKEFDLSEYIETLEKFRSEEAEAVRKYWGSMEAFDEFIQRARDHEEEIAKSAVRYYGSVEKYTAAMKDNLAHFSEHMEHMQEIKEKGYVEKNKQLQDELYKDIKRDPASDEVQDIIRRLMELGEETSMNMDMGENYWDVMIDGYLHNDTLIAAIDKLYGDGASRFTGEAYRCYLKNKK
ncbi:MerR family transcriptional regulator [Clostridium sp. AN503]|uniref:MerR family transcriptional regulator n=1 Tax=Clostridium sp. AN503 TaxID=3160598 RepID=UPI003457A64D